MARSLDAAIEQAASDGTDVVLLTGKGDRFCAGGDLAWIWSVDDREEAVRQLALYLEETFRKLSTLDQIVVCAVQGAVAGAGLALILSADIVVAASSTKFVMAYSGVGLTPDCGVSQLLGRAVGQHRALDLALTGRVLSATEAHEWGLVARVAGDRDLGGDAWRLATRIARESGYATRTAKRLVRTAFDVTTEDSATSEVEALSAAVTVDDTMERISAFVNRS